MKAGNLLFLSVFWAFSAQAQWATQQITLTSGWNSVYVRVSPDSMCHTLFSNTPVKAVYQFNPVLSAQYVTSPAQPLERNPEWLMWHSEGTLPPTLFSLRAGQAYLVSNASPFTLVLTGKVEQVHHEWRQDDWHLTGFDVASGMTFSRFFGTALDNIEKLQRVDSGGVSRDVVLSDTMERGQAYWIKTRGTLDFDGPVAMAGEVWLTASDATATLSISNFAATVTNTLTFTLLDAAVPLMRWIDAEGAYRAVAVNMPFTLEAGPSANPKLVFKADATGLQAGKMYTSLLRVSGGGIDSILPVTYMHESYGSGRAAWPYGLWVGNATLDQVSFVGAQDSALSPASQTLDIRLILHHATNGQLRLLSRVVGVLVTNEAGSAYRLYTDDNNLPDTSSGQDVFRISSLAFGLMPPLDLSGTFLGSEPSIGSWTMDAQDPTNPYRHLFHHDLQTGFAISNDVIFTWLDGTNAPLVGGSAQNPNGYCSGSYEQRITGVRHQEIRTRGTFLLEWVSGTGSLD